MSLMCFGCFLLCFPPIKWILTTRAWENNQKGPKKFTTQWLVIHHSLNIKWCPAGSRAGSVCVELVTQMSKQQMKQDLDAVVVIKPIASNQLNVTQDFHKLGVVNVAGDLGYQRNHPFWGESIWAQIFLATNLCFNHSMVADSIFGAWPI